MGGGCCKGGAQMGVGALSFCMDRIYEERHMYVFTTHNTVERE